MVINFAPDDHSTRQRRCVVNDEGPMGRVFSFQPHIVVDEKVDVHFRPVINAQLALQFSGERFDGFRI